MEHLRTFTKMDFRRERKIRQVFQSLRASVCELPYGEMAVVYMRFWEDRSTDDIAQELELSAGFVERLLNSALERLKGALLHLHPDYIPYQAPKCA